MTTKNNISRTIIKIYDAVKGDDDESRADLELIETYIQGLEDHLDPVVMGIGALYLHCFATEVVSQLDESTGDLFGIGEDCFIVKLYPYSELIATIHEEELAKKRKFSGTFVYDVMEELAGLFISSIMRQEADTMEHEFPELDEFKLDVVRVVPSYSIGPAFKG